MNRVQQIPIVAQDPSIRGADGTILKAIVTVPDELLDEGPRGHRVAVIDYDSTRRVYYEPWRLDPAEPRSLRPADDRLTDDRILTDPAFHARNTYAIAMRTLMRFELALGRRVAWGFEGQTLKIAPHAFEDLNAYYSHDDQALLFGYAPSRKHRGRWIYSCLAHDVVVHETTHAILDGLRERYRDLSHPDQSAFQEGFADVVALLSVFSLREIVRHTLSSLPDIDRRRWLIPRESLTVERLGTLTLLQLAEEIGSELSETRGLPLRHSASLVAGKVDLNAHEFQEPHRRGEILVAAMLHTFLAVWVHRLERSGDGKGPVSVGFATAEAAEVADVLLTAAIKALDYAPPVDVRFGDYLSALLTSDKEIRADDSKYQLRRHITHWFRQYGIRPAGTEDDGTWTRCRSERFAYEGTHIESIQRSPEEVFRFLWENRQELRLSNEAYTHVISVRPSLRSTTDGFAVRETIAEYKQTLSLRARDARGELRRPPDMQDSTPLTLSGGGLLIFDEYGRLKYHVYQRLWGERQSERLEVLWRRGLIDGAGRLAPRPTIASIHAERTGSAAAHDSKEVW
ncbi:MAG: hypothetical protein IT372_02405 [Polyangiaceae bacterium]|nr:hypothetical protein [Polyangiaceae bacterium]